MKLSKKRISYLQKPGRYGDGNGLYLQIGPGGSQSWLFRYERGGRERAMGLGAALDLSLEEARELAGDARKLLRQGLDPIDRRTAERRAAEERIRSHSEVAFEAIARRYHAFHSPKWSNLKHAAQFLSTLEAYVFPLIGKRPVSLLQTADILEVLEPIWPTKTETAGRVRGRIEAVLDYAKVHNLRSGENPASWGGNLKHALPAPNAIRKVKHHAALPFIEIAAFIDELKKREGYAARALEFLILTAARTNEVINATWDEIDLEAAAWIIPAQRMKARKEHRIPLSERAVSILRQLPREHDYPFIGPQRRRPISNMAMAELLKRMGRQDITVHGFRSSFRDWAAERTTYPNHVVEMALAHTVKNKVEAAYRRGDLFDKRKPLMSQWASFCETKHVPENVITFGQVKPPRTSTLDNEEQARSKIDARLGQRAAGST